MKIIVNIKNYTRHKYPKYMNRGVEVKPTNEQLYVPGMLVVEDEECISVVLGCIDESYGDLRTDWSGMISMEMIRPCTVQDLANRKIKMGGILIKELYGEL